MGRELEEGTTPMLCMATCMSSPEEMHERVSKARFSGIGRSLSGLVLGLSRSAVGFTCTWVAMWYRRLDTACTAMFLI